MNGKGDKDTRTPNYEKRREAWDRIFGKKDEGKYCKEVQTEVKEVQTEKEEKDDTV